MTPEKSRQAELKEKRRFWEQHVEDWQTSELSQAEFCRKHHLKVHRFIYWKKKFQTPKPSRTLIELKLPPVAYPPTSSSVSPLQVSVSRFQVAVERDFDPVTLRQLIYSLERL